METKYKDEEIISDSDDSFVVGSKRKRKYLKTITDKKIKPIME